MTNPFAPPTTDTKSHYADGDTVDLGGKRPMTDEEITLMLGEAAAIRKKPETERNQEQRALLVWALKQINDESGAPRENENFARTTTAPEDDLSMSIADAYDDPKLLESPERLSWLAWKGLATMFTGNLKLGKSTATASDARNAVLKGLKVLFFSVDESLAGTVSRFHAFEDADGLQDKFRAQLRIIRAGVRLTDWSQLDRIVARHQPDLVYLDAWDALVQRCEVDIPGNGDSARWRGIADRLVGLSRTYGCSTIVNIHPLKSNHELFSGNQQVAAGFDVMATLTRHGEYTRKVAFITRLSEETPDLILRWKGPALGCVEADAPTGTTLAPKDRQLLHAICQTPGTKTALQLITGLSDWQFKSAAAELGRTGRGFIDCADGTYIYTATAAGCLENLKT